MHNKDTIYVRNEYINWDFSLEMAKEWVQVSIKPLAIHSASWIFFLPWNATLCLKLELNGNGWVVLWSPKSH